MLSLKSNGALNTFGRMEVNTSKTETGANKQILHIPEKRRSEAWVSNYGHVLWLSWFSIWSLVADTTCLHLIRDMSWIYLVVRVVTFETNIYVEFYRILHVLPSF